MPHSSLIKGVRSLHASSRSFNQADIELYHDGLLIILHIYLTSRWCSTSDESLLKQDGFRQPTRTQGTMSPLLAMGIYGAYQSNAAKQIAVTYLGEHTVKRVLDGEFSW